MNKNENETLRKACEEALKQIEEKQYSTELLDRGINNIITLGIAFHGKNVLVRQKFE